LIEVLLSSNHDSLESRYAREQRLNKLLDYLTEVEKKSTGTLNQILNAQEKSKLKEIADIIKLLNELIETVYGKGIP
jgi:HPt (histidine-containing phosphotransfer) domain-containing protein